jgi:hypothetical protein
MIAAPRSLNNTQKREHKMATRDNRSFWNNLALEPLKKSTPA